MSVDSNGSSTTLDPEEGNVFETNSGMKSLIKSCKALFRIPENPSHYSERNHKIAERKALKFD
jgi:hypothetical protein